MRFLLILLSAALVVQAQSLGDLARQERERKAQQQKKTQTITNEDVKQTKGYQDQVPEVSGMQKCGADACFLAAVNAGKPASLTRSETSKESHATVTATSTWWVLGCPGEPCEVFFRADAFHIEPDPEKLAELPDEDRKKAESMMEQGNHDFETVRGRTNSCVVQRTAVKGAFENRRLSFVALGGLAGGGKNCAGPMFAPLKPAAPAPPAPAPVAPSKPSR